MIKRRIFLDDESYAEYISLQDVQYGDIDYMERQLDFTYSKERYEGLPDFVRDLKKEGIRYITILDPAIGANETGYEAYDLGKALDIFIKDPNSNQPMFGKVWPDYPNITVDTSKPWDYQVKNYRSYAAFPDFFHPKIDQWWGKLIKDFHNNTLEFDGLWIDMNEPANFVKGSVNGCPSNSLESPPYKPKIAGDVLADKTLCMSANHSDGVPEYNYHSLYGLSQSSPTLMAAQQATGKRSIVISRSTYPSSGRYAGHWLGDNRSVWPHLHKSIIGMLEFSLFGIPYIGADICGFFDDTTEPLCERWMQLGAFYPFSRNHNGKGYKPQDPAVFGDSFAKMSRDILHTRYTILPYLYTLFYEAHVKGSTVVRPLMHEFTSDKNTWTIDRQFLWGPAVLISPVLDENAVSVIGYVPKARWYDFYTPDRHYTPVDYHGMQKTSRTGLTYNYGYISN